MSLAELAIADVVKSPNGAGGDGHKTPVKKRVPVNSSRKFTPKIAKSDTNQRKIHEALQEIRVEERASVLKRKSLTLSEIETSSRTPNKKRLASGARTGATPTSPPRRFHDDAGRRVYQRLLLNAWRRKRSQVATLTDSSDHLHAQVKQLQMQVEVLQQLRQSESRRRSETSVENIELKIAYNTSLAKIKNLQHEAKEYAEKEKKLKSKIEQIKADFLSITNDLSLCQNDMVNYEKQLTNERNKINDLIAAKLKAQQKISENEAILRKRDADVQELKAILAQEQENAQNAVLRTKELDLDKHKLVTALEKEKERCRLLETELQSEYAKYDKSKTKINHLKQHVIILKESKNTLLEENEALKESFRKLLAAIRSQSEKPWWRNFGEILISSLQNTALLMLPALPRKYSRDRVDIATPA